VTFFGQVRVDEGGGSGRGAKYEFNMNKTAALFGLGTITLLAAFVLWIVEKDTAAPYFFSLGEAIVVGGFGVAYGEKTGAESAAELPAQSPPGNPV
jgi:hypothetical protein